MSPGVSTAETGYDEIKYPLGTFFNRAHRGNITLSTLDEIGRGFCAPSPFPPLLAIDGDCGIISSKQASVIRALMAVRAEHRTYHYSTRARRLPGKRAMLVSFGLRVRPQVPAGGRPPINLEPTPTYALRQLPSLYDVHLKDSGVCCL